jgi:hypothetical protein
LVRAHHLETKSQVCYRRRLTQKQQI